MGPLGRWSTREGETDGTFLERACFRLLQAHYKLLTLPNPNATTPHGPRCPCCPTPDPISRRFNAQVRATRNTNELRRNLLTKPAAGFDLGIRSCSTPLNRLRTLAGIGSFDLLPGLRSWVELARVGIQECLRLAVANRVKPGLCWQDRQEMVILGRCAGSHGYSRLNGCPVFALGRVVGLPALRSSPLRRHVRVGSSADW